MDSVKFYCSSKPKVGEIVQVIFTARGDDHATGYLTEYYGNVIMAFSQATKRKKIRSINKLIPLNKPMAVIIETFNESSKNGDVSKAYLDETDENYNNKFISNRKLYSGIYQICQKLKIDFNSLWENDIYPFLIKIQTDNEEEIILDNFIDNMNNLEKLLSENEKNSLSLIEEIKQNFSKIEVSQQFKKIFGIISNNGIDCTKKLFENTLNHEDIEEYKDSISIKYFNTPNYLVETNVSEEVLNDFIEVLQENAKEIKNVYVKIS